jgi:hypothetical protein
VPGLRVNRRVRRPRRVSTEGPPSDVWLVGRTDSAPSGPLPVVVATPGERRHAFEFVLLAAGAPDSIPLVAAGRDNKDWVMPSQGRPVEIAIWSGPAAVTAWTGHFRPDKPAPDGWATLFATEAEARAGRNGS